MSNITLPCGGNRIVTASSAVPAITKFDAHRLKVDRNRIGRTVLITADKIDRPTIDITNLKACSSAYDIPASIDDYVITEIAACNVGLPNRNMDAFPLESALRWRPELGRVAWQTFRWKATNINHVNKDPLKAKGVIFDSYMKKLRDHHYHVMALCGWSKSKDPELAKRVMEDPRCGFSMACLVGEASCSICAFKSTGGNVTCRHVAGGVGKGTLWEVEGAAPQLVYEDCDLLNWFEISAVQDPADFDSVAHWRA